MGSSVCGSSNSRATAGSSDSSSGGLGGSTVVAEGGLALGLTKRGGCKCVYLEGGRGEGEPCL